MDLRQPELLHGSMLHKSSLADYSIPAVATAPDSSALRVLEKEWSGAPQSVRRLCTIYRRLSFGPGTVEFPILLNNVI